MFQHAVQTRIFMHIQGQVLQQLPLSQRPAQFHSSNWGSHRNWKGGDLHLWVGLSLTCAVAPSKSIQVILLFQNLSSLCNSLGVPKGRPAFCVANALACFNFPPSLQHDVWRPGALF